MKQSLLYTLIFLFLMVLSACEKVSPTGILIAASNTDDRIRMSLVYYQTYLDEKIDMEVPGDYSFIVGSDSHLTTDTTRIAEMMKIGLDNDALLYAHLGDIADTKGEYYIRLDHVLQTFKRNYVNKYFQPVEGTEEHYIANSTGKEFYYDEIVYPFFPVAGNHDITHNGWALFTSLFHSSFYELTVKIGATGQFDRFIFLDSANGTFGRYQLDLISEGFFDTALNIRNTFVFTHSNIFRPITSEFASTFAREELYYALTKFREWDATIVFMGHVHAWDDRVLGGVRYLTLDSMCEKDHPEEGDFLVRVWCGKQGEVDVSKVTMQALKN